MVILDKVHRLMRRAVVVRGGRAVQRAVAGRQLHWYELEGAGRGPAAVLVHGLGGSANSFFSILSPLRRSFSRLYVPDLPGHGFTPLEPGHGPLDVRGHFEVLKAFLDEVVGAPAVMIGNSMGGALSLQVAIERPATPGLGLLSPAGAPLGNHGLQQLRTNFHLRSRADAMRMMRRMLHHAPLGSWLVARDMQEMFDTPVVHHVIASTTPEDAVDPAALRALPMPVTLVWGASEGILPSHGVDYFRAHLPAHARIEVFDRCGHLPMIEQPRRTVAVLEDLARDATAWVVRPPTLRTA